MFCGYRAEGGVMLQTKNNGDWGGGGPGYHKYGERGRERNREGYRRREREIEGERGREM